MTFMLRIVLIIVSMATTALIMRRIRQSKLQIEDSIFWIGFSFILILFSIFPQIPAILARMAGTYTTANFIFLSVIFLLIVKMFHMSIKMSQLESRVKELVQEMALEENRRTAEKSNKTEAGVNAETETGKGEDLVEM
ncbi:DUF2304 domain-containing protein [uncultured Clostridium sp.]|uniref:DUF2304 domain-containing protein n=1 Tax=uncultured Clostridium sp. TaxID=59620 RepID=UPI0025F89013|nr:DUF2304 domain-containing protein [uncultured Clostridium sp.]